MTRDLNYRNYSSDFPNMAQDDGEFAALLTRLDTLKPTSLLEIGCWQGGVLARFAARYPSANVVGVDVTRANLDGQAHNKHEGYLNFRGAKFYEGASQDETVMRRLLADNDGPFDFVLIDGDHTYESASLDWRWALGNTRRCVALHDVNARDNAMCDVYKLWDEIRDSGYDCETLGGQSAYGIGVVWL